VSTNDTNQEYSGDVAILACANDPQLMLFFPVSEENASMLTYALDEDSEININTTSLGIYQTMIDSWRSSDKFLSGIIMDMVYDHEVKEDVMSVRLTLSTKNGLVDSVVRVNFIHGILLSVMEGMSVIVTNELLSRLIPDSMEEEDYEDYEDREDNEDEGNESDLRKSGINKHRVFPQDKNILDIVKNILDTGEKPNIPTITTTTTTLPTKKLRKPRKPRKPTRLKKPINKDKPEKK